MKRFLLTLMVLVMFFPGLACAKFMAHSGASAQLVHCHELKKQSPDSATALFKDCMKADLSSADLQILTKNITFEKHDLFKVYFSTTLPSHHHTVFYKASDPPYSDQQLATSYAQLPTYLSTQRLRI